MLSKGCTWFIERSIIIHLGLSAWVATCTWYLKAISDFYKFLPSSSFLVKSFDVDVPGFRGN